MKTFIDENERVDDTGFGNIRLIQKPDDFCYGVDAVLLADFAKVQKGSSIVDLGSGTGIIPLILSHKTKETMICGIEVQRDSYERAIRNIKLNNLEKQVKLYNCNVKDFKSDYKFQAVTCNPPYNPYGGGLTNKNEAKTIARHEVLATLEDFIKCGASLLEDKGSFYMIHRPSRMVDIFCTCRKYNLEPKTICLISPNADQTPNLFLMEAKKFGGSELKILDPVNIYNFDGTYTDQIMKIYER